LPSEDIPAVDEWPRRVRGRPAVYPQAPRGRPLRLDPRLEQGGLPRTVLGRGVVAGQRVESLADGWWLAGGGVPGRRLVAGRGVVPVGGRWLSRIGARRGRWMSRIGALGEPQLFIRDAIDSSPLEEPADPLRSKRRRAPRGHEPAQRSRMNARRSVVGPRVAVDRRAFKRRGRWSRMNAARSGSGSEDRE
jgi:hypothetical protein